MLARRLWALCFLLLPVVLARWTAPAIHGRVLDERARPLSGAVVRYQGTAASTSTDAGGWFSLPAPWKAGLRITAAKPGFVIGWSTARAVPLVVRLESLPAQEDDDYSWIDPHADPARPHNCANCHADLVRDWSKSAHARSATNRKMLALFAGSKKDWSLEKQHPLGMGVCAACHAPTLESPTLEYDLRQAEGVAARGVHCDYCHKIQDAPTDKLGTRFGRDGYRLLRPKDGLQLFFGPLADAVRPGEAFSYAPFYKESRYCASCHEGTIFGVHVYGTYSEWLASPARATGKQCQACHMPSTGKRLNLAPGQGGIRRDPWTLSDHAFPGAAESLRDCLRVDVKAARQDDRVTVDVEVRADNVGHCVPTGFIDRHLVLVVEATDAAGITIRPRQGAVLSGVAGAELAGQAGWLYARWLEDAQGAGPLPFWQAHEKMRDTRLMPGQADRRRFVFPPEGQSIRVTLRYRRFWPQVADFYGWRDNETVLFEGVYRP